MDPVDDRLPIRAKAAATAACAAGHHRLSDDQVTEIISCYRGAVIKGITDNRASAPARGRAGCGWALARAVNPGFSERTAASSPTAASRSPSVPVR